MSMWRVVERLQLGMAGDGLVRGFLHGAARTVEFVNAFSLVGDVSMSKKTNRSKSHTVPCVDKGLCYLERFPE
jgi:hypothetical protein